MGTTTNLGLPYPEGTDLVIAGDDAIQALAEATEAALAPAWCSGSSAAPYAIGTGLTVPFTLTGSGHFALGLGDVITYSGPPRFFIITATVEVTSGVTSNTFAELNANSGAIGLSQSMATIESGQYTTHVLTHAGSLGDGDNVHVDIFATGDTGQVAYAGLRIVSISAGL